MAGSEAVKPGEQRGKRAGLHPTTKMNKHYSIPGLGAAAAVVLAGIISSHAATVAAPAAGDLFLGFRASGGQGASVSYLVNIGNDLTYRNSPVGSSFDVSGVGNIGADLISAYGSNWNARADLFWGIFGTRASVNSSVYASREQDPIGTITAPWSALDSTGRNGTSGAITSVISEVGGYTGSDATANSAVATLQPNSGAASSYNRQVASPGTTDFGSLSQWSSIEGDFGSGTAGTALDLYRIGSTGVSRVGTFSLSDTGILHFAAPVPEPGSAALGSAAVLLALRRRRRATTTL